MTASISTLRLPLGDRRDHATQLKAILERDPRIAFVCLATRQGRLWRHAVRSEGVDAARTAALAGQLVAQSEALSSSIGQGACRQVMSCQEDGVVVATRVPGRLGRYLLVLAMDGENIALARHLARDAADELVALDEIDAGVRSAALIA